MNIRGDSTRLAVVDYDGCAFTDFVISTSKKNTYRRNIFPFVLSPGLIKYVRDLRCHAFYACTHRCRLSAFEVVFGDERFSNGKEWHLDKFHPEYGFTSSITDNLQSILTLPCEAVSTPDDFLPYDKNKKARECGRGFVEYIKPFELELAQKNAEKIAARQNTGLDVPVCPEMVSDGFRAANIVKKMIVDDKRCKNEQLLMIARDARKQYPRGYIDLIFFDDDINICKHACQIDPAKLPRGMSIHILNHSGLNQTTEYIGVVTSAKQMRNSLFTEHRQRGSQHNLKDLFSLTRKTV